MVRYYGVEGKWTSGFGDDYDIYTVYADDKDIATYEVRENGSLDRMWSCGAIAMTTPTQMDSREQAISKCEQAWDSHISNGPVLEDYFHDH